MAAHGSAYLLTHRSWTSRIGTVFRKCSFSRPRRRVTTSPASSSTLRCFITPKRVIGNRCSSALSVCPSSLNSSSSRVRRVGSARALNTSSTRRMIGDHMVTCQGRGGGDIGHRGPRASQRRASGKGRTGPSVHSATFGALAAGLDALCMWGMHNASRPTDLGSFDALCMLRSRPRSAPAAGARRHPQPGRACPLYSTFGSMFVAIAMRFVRLYIALISATSQASSSVRPASRRVWRSSRVTSRGRSVSFSA